MRKYLYFLLPLIIIIAAVVIIIYRSNEGSWNEFDGQRAFNGVKYQVDLGPRTMGSAAHAQTVDWIILTLQEENWNVETQKSDVTGQNLTNIIAKRGNGAPWIIIASHYDSRSLADRDLDPAGRKQAVPGANDGASTVAILLELARDIPTRPGKQIWLVFFDNEDNGDSSGAGWDIGAEYFVSQLKGKPDSVVVLDMLGDKDLNIYMEQNSNRVINQEIWGVAKQLGFSQFIPQYRHSVIDDHIPFIEAGIRAVDVIDIDYPYWHTTQDTLDKISAESLTAAGETILKWLEQYPK